MRYVTNFAFCLVALLMQDCEEDDTLPPATSEGRGKFGCYVNGKLWLPDGRNHQVGTLIVTDNRIDTTALTIYAENVKSDENFSIFVYDVPDLLVGKKYDYGQNKYYVQFTKIVGSTGCFLDVPISGYVQFTRIDFANRVISGTFEFKLTGNECAEEVIVTDGRFDIGEIMG
jgi:hypothetical protein